MELADVYSLESEVRDNETDLQGIVNNANYFIYMAHARHKHLKELGIDFNEMHQKGYDLLLLRSEIDFKGSLRSGDAYIITSKFIAEGRIRFACIQDIIRKSDSKIVTSAKNICVCISIETKKPVIPEKFQPLFEKEKDG